MKYMTQKMKSKNYKALINHFNKALKRNFKINNNKNKIHNQIYKQIKINNLNILLILKKKKP